MKTRSFKTAEFPRLRGEGAIWALYDFINELEEQRGKELTEKQTAALIRLAKALICSVGAEMRSSTSTEEMLVLLRSSRFVSQLRKTIMKRVQESVCDLDL